MVGLGNPGAEYADTRHNVGFWLADALATRWKLPRFRREGRSLATGGDPPNGPVHLLKPQTMMNDSGRALSGLRAPEAGAPLDDLLVLVDDFALPVGVFRIRSRGSAGGHNGLKSIEQQVNTQHYARLRIGIGPLPVGTNGHRDFVLEVPPRDERREIEELLPVMCEAVECWMDEGAEKAMARFNKKTKPTAEDSE
ncbi:MAG: aminoacyl-tRNA hydrolase [Gemmatimonadales bacterium]|nr:aminoacyl-tRNA hydrolase [Gemmatimonadales bacterium]